VYIDLVVVERTSFILAVAERTLNESDNEGEEHLSALLSDRNTDARLCLLYRLVNGREYSSSFYRASARVTRDLELYNV